MKAFRSLENTYDHLVDLLTDYYSDLPVDMREQMERELKDLNDIIIYMEDFRCLQRERESRTLKQ